MRIRTRAREVAFQLLYQFDLARQESGTPPPQDEKLTHEISVYFQHFDVPAPAREFASTLIDGTLKNQAQLDALIEKYAKNWKLNRLPVVDRNLLRMALFELSHLKDTPVSVVIDEALELGKQFGTADTPSFLNGVLDAAARELRSAS